MKFIGHNVATVLMFVLIHQKAGGALRGWQRIIEKEIFVGGKKTKNKNGALKFCTRGEGERRGSFEPVACQSFSVFLCEEMSESSLFLLHATSPESLGKPAAQVGEKLSLWTLKEERKKKLPCFWTFTTATYTTAAPQWSVHGNKNIKSNNLGVEHTAGEDSCVLLVIINWKIYSWVYFLHFHYFSCVPLGLYHTSLNTGRTFWT